MPALDQPTALPMQFANIPSEQPVRAISDSVKPFKEVNVMDEQSKAYRLADEFNTIDKQQRARSDRDVLQEALSQGAEMETPEGVASLAKKLKGKVSPEAYGNLVKISNDLKIVSSKADEHLMQMNETKLANMQKQSEFAVSSMATLMDEYEKDVKEKGLPDAVDAFDQKKQATVQAMVQAQAITPQVAEQFMKMSPSEFSAKVKSSKYWADKIKSAAELKKTEAQTRMYEGKADTEEAGGQAAVAYQNIVDQYGEDSPQAKAALNKMSGRGSAGGASADPSMTPDAIEMIAKRVLSGDKTALQNIGRGTQGSANIAAIQNRVGALGKETGKGAQEIMQAQAEIAAANKGLQTLATRSAKIDAAAIELDKFADNALESIKHVDRGPVTPLNALWRKVELGTGSPEEVDLITKTKALVGAYASVIGRGSTTVHSLQEAEAVIGKAYSELPFEAMVKALKTEAKAVQESSDEAGKHIKEKAFGKSPEAGLRAKAQGDMGADPKALDREIAATTADLAKVSDPTSKQELSTHLQDLTRQKMAIGGNGAKNEPPTKNAKGWTLHKDAKGNMAYVGPNNEIEEVPRS